MSFLLEQNVATNEVDVVLLGAVGVVLEPNGIAHLVKQLSRTWFHMAVTDK